MQLTQACSRVDKTGEPTPLQRTSDPKPPTQEIPKAMVGIPIKATSKKPKRTKGVSAGQETNQAAQSVSNTNEIGCAGCPHDEVSHSIAVNSCSLTKKAGQESSVVKQAPTSGCAAHPVNAKRQRSSKRTTL